MGENKKVLISGGAKYRFNAEECTNVYGRTFEGQTTYQGKIMITMPYFVSTIPIKILETCRL